MFFREVKARDAPGFNRRKILKAVVLLVVVVDVALW
jgi:hypothetical protein